MVRNCITAGAGETSFVHEWILAWSCDSWSSIPHLSEPGFYHGRHKISQLSNDSDRASKHCREEIHKRYRTVESYYFATKSCQAGILSVVQSIIKSMPCASSYIYNETTILATCIRLLRGHNTLPFFHAVIRNRYPKHLYMLQLHPFFNGCPTSK
jgi:hypothetical protein